MYAKTAQYVKSRKDFTEDMLEGLEEIVMDSAKAKAIYDASKSSMGKSTASVYVACYRLKLNSGEFNFNLYHVHVIFYRITVVCW